MSTTRTVIGEALEIAVGDLPEGVTKSVRADARPGQGPWLYVTTMQFVVREVDDAMVEAFERADSHMARAALLTAWGRGARAALAAELRLMASRLADVDEDDEGVVGDEGGA